MSMSQAPNIGDLLDSGEDVTRAPLPGPAVSPYGPYLDVLTVRGPLAPVDEGEPHSHLLVEPVLLPRMTHLDVEKTVQPEDTPLFYASGEPNANLRNTLHNVIRESSIPRHIDRDLGKIDIPARTRVVQRATNVAGPASHRTVTAKTKRRVAREEARKCSGGPPKPGAAASQSRQVHALRSDTQTRQLLKTVRANSDKLTRLGMLS